MARDPFLLHLREFIRQQDLVNAGDSILVAVSGGVDSMVLLHGLAELAGELSIRLAVAHFNHELRGPESDADEVFVRSAAGSFGLECYVERARTSAIAGLRKNSIQETARDLRYAFFTKLRTSIGFTGIATAHHADDNAETMLFNFLRGAGVYGLSGIPVRRGDIAVIRPLLFARREEILGFVSARGIAFREDSSNAKQEYTRNYIRNTLIPELEQNLNPNLTATLRRNAEIFDHLERYLESQSETLIGSVVTRRTPVQLTLDINALQSQHTYLREHLLRTVVKSFTSAEVDFSTIRMLLHLSGSETGSSVSLTKEFAAYRDRDCLVIRRVPASSPFRYHVELHKEYQFEHFGFGSKIVSETGYSNNPRVEFVDADLLSGNCVLRTWNDGDWFIPLGMTEKKKLSDFFVDEKVPLFEKRHVPILADNDSVVWICGHRLDDRYKITGSTKRIIKLEYLPRHIANE